MSLRPSTRTARSAMLIAAALALTACATAQPEHTALPAETAEEAQPHGYVEGAAELAEPQQLLAAVDAAGAVRLLDPVTEQVVEVADVGAVEHLADDGRFLAATTADGVTIVDTGVWTVDHGDHAHYYRAEPRVVGTLALDGAASIRSSEATTTVLADDTVVVLDRDALGHGEIVETARIEGAAPDGFAAPGGDGAIVAMPDAVAVIGSEGQTVVEQPCADPAGGTVTRVGVVVGCAEGAVLATETDAGVELERIDYPAGTDPALRASGFDLRPGRATAAAIAGDAGLWLLDTRERSWTLIETEAPLERAVAVDDADGHVVAIDEAGRVLVLDGDGAPVGATEPVLAASLADDAVRDALALEVDASRAYVPLAAEGAVLEIDYADGARIARSLAIDAPLHLAETGR
ncbi:ABC transporter [Agrococcus sp. ARC_14]|uniref:ABC transporter n=1 Tax=Agrococcus sp. ARC_14 TaxID=2919927 RepID=UPI001F06502B|nr:ABC transporter [Agrococcus sp. ARC_14]MCH1881663.1 ABC transporter [Agrococcus sp. ARC_14]